MNAYVFPGQGSQYSGMGKELYQRSKEASSVFNTANDILEFDLKRIMFEANEQELQKTEIAQLAILIHSIASTKAVENFNPQGVAGHSLGEYSALASIGSFTLENAIYVVKERSEAMKKAAEENPGSMLAIIGLDDNKILEICERLENKVNPANFNCPGQVVVSGTREAIELATDTMKKAGAKKIIQLKVSGAFHTEIMKPAKEQLRAALDKIDILPPSCPIYQNVNAKPTQDPEIIKHNLIEQISSPVKWTHTIQNMVTDGFDNFTEFGPGKVLQGLIKRINPNVQASKYS